MTSTDTDNWKHVSECLPQLKPCPFCGDRMEVDLSHTLRHVEQTEGCPIASLAWPVERASWWNTRAAGCDQ